MACRCSGKYVAKTSDFMDTYTAAGIAIQCAGTNINRSFTNSGEGIAQITKNEAKTEWGKPIYKYILGLIRTDDVRSYGLRKRCPDGELEKILNPNNTSDAVELMKRRIQIVTEACKNCTSTDIYIAASLAQNGPGYTYKDMEFLPKLPHRDSEIYKIRMNWSNVLQMT